MESTLGYFGIKNPRTNTHFYYKDGITNDIYNLIIADSFASSINTTCHFEVRNEENYLIKSYPKSQLEPNLMLEPTRPVEYRVKNDDDLKIEFKFILKIKEAKDDLFVLFIILSLIYIAFILFPFYLRDAYHLYP